MTGWGSGGPLRAVVTGGAGFLGSHLCRRLLLEGWEVTCLDSFLTGRAANIDDLAAHPRFRFERRDVTEPLSVHEDLDCVFHFASPASPRDYLDHPIETLRVGALGTLRCLEMAEAKGAAFFLASTSEVYGDPTVHPQPESYWGNVNPIGPRSVYDEAKRYSEALSTAYRRARGIVVRSVRIFNTYGPGMRPGDGRAVPTFISQALAGEPLTVHGQGAQTRSLCYVDDLVEGIWRLSQSDVTDPVNLGNPEEVSVLQLAELVRDLTGSRSEVRFTPRPTDDRELRRPDITRARAELGWEPRVPLRLGVGSDHRSGPTCLGKRCHSGGRGSFCLRVAPPSLIEPGRIIHRRQRHGRPRRTTRGRNPRSAHRPLRGRPGAPYAPGSRGPV